MTSWSWWPASAGPRTLVSPDAVLLHRTWLFPLGRSEIPDEAVEYVAGQVGADSTEFAFYDFAGRTSRAHRALIREVLGFRQCAVADAEALTDWLVEQMTQLERRSMWCMSSC